MNLILLCILLVFARDRLPKLAKKDNNKNTVSTESHDGSTKGTSPPKEEKPCNQGNVDSVIEEHSSGKSPKDNKRTEITDSSGFIRVENYKLDHDEVYIGTLKDGKRNGQGTLIWPNGDKYIGSWKDDLFEGFGTFTKVTGEKYEGNWKAGLPQGKGKEICVDGRVYEGEFQHGVKQGEGIMKWRNDKFYEGQFSNDTFHGKGKLKKANGAVYEGSS